MDFTNGNGKGGPEPFENEIKKMLSSLRED